MWSALEETRERRPSSTPPVLSLFSIPSQLPEPPGMRTPPRLTLASIPFLWEEAPGKPRQCKRSESDSQLPQGGKSLELPPRLLNEARQSNLLSLTTVLDGPYLGKALSSTLSFRSPPESWGKRPSEIVKEKGGSRRWGSFRKSKDQTVGGGFDFPPAVLDGACDNYGGAEVDFGKPKPRRKGSSSIPSSVKSQFLVNIYESFKQAVPWRRRQR